MFFWIGFIKQAKLKPGERADKASGVRPVTLVSSRGRTEKTKLPSADPNISKKEGEDPEIKFKLIPKLRKTKSETNI